eukprot:TRINITY_DN348_c0_g1_i2.p1 TRINITY_DN348_c0_g1~~TRINITY_DN348_c0_g1_i2.p1  ORF type:complete len:625 (-),score=45.13 TRINITY_DN348_c0_g1_i2:1611-3452(-)
MKSSGQVRELDVKSYARGRAQELKTLQHALSSVGGSKRVFQMLPKHLRRRASSHNIYRIPVRLRAQAKREMEKAPPVHTRVSRRVRRRRHQLETEALRRQTNGDQWLPTHLWAVKRMRMESRWGYKMATRPSDKGARAAYAASSHGSVIQDVSHLGIVQVHGGYDTITRVIDAQELSYTPYTAGDRHGRFMLRDHGEKVDIGPVSFIWRAGEVGVQGIEGQRTLWLLTHPAMHNDALAYLQRLFPKTKSSSHGVTVTSLQTLGCLEVHGPRSHRSLANALSPAGTTSPVQRQALDTLCQLRAPACVPSQCVLGLECKVPDQGGNYRAAHAHASNSSSTTPTRSSDVVDAVDSPVSTPWTVQHAASTLWDRHAQQGNEPIKFTAAKNREDLLVAWKSPGDHLGDAGDGPVIPVLLLSLPSQQSRGYGGGWRLILPRVAVSVFWQAFIETGCRPIGLENKDQMCLEAGILRFPQDFPTTKAYATHVQHERAARQQRHTALPKSKQSMVSLIPDDWPVLTSRSHTTIVPVSLTAKGKGRPAPWQRIYQGERIVGMVTSGFHSYCRGKGYGIGYLVLDSMEEAETVLATKTKITVGDKRVAVHVHKLNAPGGAISLL